MDRQIVYPGSIPLDTDILGSQRSTMIALGYLAQMVLGTSTVAEGLACVPTQPASMSVSVGAGSITQYGVIDTTPYGSLPALSTSPLIRIGVNIGASSFTLAAPAASGQVINYLIQASLLEADGGVTVLPYYNAANPAQPFSGPGNNSAQQMTQRRQTVQIAVKPGSAAAIGSQALPVVDAGWVGLYVISVAFGQNSITAASISTLPTAPFLYWKLPQLTPGTHNLAVFKPSSQGSWTVPAGVSAVKLRIWGGGGAGGNGFGGAGGGGSGGGYVEGYYSVGPGQIYSVIVGNGGIGPTSSGEDSSFGSLASATGGSAGAAGSNGGGGSGATAAGTGAVQGLSVPGCPGGDGMVFGNMLLSGAGGGAHGGSGAFPVGGNSSAMLSGRNGVGTGCGGSGGVGAGAGGQGGPGLVLAEW